MGIGDNLMASGMARGAHARGKKVAFGDGRTIIWDPNSAMVFRGNPNVAKPGEEVRADLEWIAYYKGRRIYNSRSGNRWVWNYDFSPTPGEMFFTDDELAFSRQHGSKFVVIEPNGPGLKGYALNKQWPIIRYEKVARYLWKNGYDVRQFVYGPGTRLRFAKPIKTPSFRHGLAALAQASLYIGPEGGLHHGAAAVGVPAVVLFGGFIPPAVTGYPTHTNLTGGAKACGSLTRCQHCVDAMAAISVDEVHEAALERLGENSCMDPLSGG